MVFTCVLILALVLSPLFYPDESPAEGRLHPGPHLQPPAAPPAAAARGASTKPVEKAPEKTGAKPPDPDVLVEPKVPDDPKPVEPEKGIDPLKQFGVETGSEAGSVDGMEAGLKGARSGERWEERSAGVIGGTGDSPVMDYDQPPRLLKKTQPVYPQEAFIKKIEGTVMLEILIGVDGRVGRARVLRSIPQLDAAAIQSVRQWIFSPAIKGGRAGPDHGSRAREFPDFLGPESRDGALSGVLSAVAFVPVAGQIEPGNPREASGSVWRVFCSDRVGVT